MKNPFEKVVKLSIIIVSYRGKEDLRNCINSIEKSSYKNYEIIVIDNFGRESMKEFEKRAKVFSPGINLGYAKGNNFGVNAAKGEYILILNPDTIINKDALELLVSYLDSNKDIRICQPRIIDLRTNKINSAGNEATVLGISYSGGYGENKDKIKKKIIEVPYPSGTCFIIRKKDYLKLGGFDESFFMYHEDYDLGVRSRLKGWKIVCNNFIEIGHQYNFKKNKIKNYHYEKNRIISILKTYKLKTLFLFTPMGVFLEIGSISASLLDGWFLDKLKGYVFILKNLNNIGWYRRRIQKNRVIDDKELFKNYKTEINFEPAKKYAKFYNFFFGKLTKLFLKWI